MKCLLNNEFFHWMLSRSETDKDQSSINYKIMRFFLHFVRNVVKIDSRKKGTFCPLYVNLWQNILSKTVLKVASIKQYGYCIWLYDPFSKFFFSPKWNSKNGYKKLFVFFIYVGIPLGKKKLIEQYDSCSTFSLNKPDYRQEISPLIYSSTKFVLLLKESSELNHVVHGTISRES